MYGRFRSTDSILSLTGQFKKPVVNIWAGWLAYEITKKWPSFSFPEQKFRFISTIDIDNAWAYKNKGFWRFSGALLKSFFKGKPNEVRNRIAFLFRSKKDPYDTYNYLDSVFKGNEDKVIFFLLLGDYHKFDKNISWKNRAFQQLIRLIASRYKTGIHPSYAAGEDLTGKLIKKEKYRFEKITGNPVEFSRMHYLKTEIPSTYRNLVNAGIQMDFTMGFASQNGFRAGICTAFRFYDLENEQCTNLQIVPLQVMDGTLMNYLHYTPDEAEIEISDLMIEVKKVGGTFVSLWHNDTVNDQAEWRGYRKVFEKMCETGFRWTNE